MKSIWCDTCGRPTPHRDMGDHWQCAEHPEATSAEIIGRATGSVAATVTHERRGEDGILYTESVEVWVKPPAEDPKAAYARDEEIRARYDYWMEKGT